MVEQLEPAGLQVLVQPYFSAIESRSLYRCYYFCFYCIRVSQSRIVDIVENNVASARDNREPSEDGQ